MKLPRQAREVSRCSSGGGRPRGGVWAADIADAEINGWRADLTDADWYAARGAARAYNQRAREGRWDVAMRQLAVLENLGDLYPRTSLARVTRREALDVGTQRSLPQDLLNLISRYDG